MGSNDRKLTRIEIVLFIVHWDTDNAHLNPTLHKKATIHQVTIMLATFKNVLFPGHNHHANHRY